jgi:hypothetical protein
MDGIDRGGLTCVVTTDDEVVEVGLEFVEVGKERGHTTLGGSYVARETQLHWDIGIAYLLDLFLGLEMV